MDIGPAWQGILACDTIVASIDSYHTWYDISSPWNNAKDALSQAASFVDLTR